MRLSRQRFIFVGLLALCSVASAPIAWTQAVALAPTKSDLTRTGSILDTLGREHIRHVEINDALSADFLDQLLEYLDPMRWIFIQSDIDSFEEHRHTLDDDLLKQDLSALYEIFNRFQERRLSRWVFMNTQLETLEELTFDKDEEFVLDRRDYSWVKSDEEAEDLWRRRFANDVLNLRLTDSETEKISDVLTRRYKDQLRRVQQFTSADAYRVAMDALTKCYDPHTEYFPPRDAENFDIQMSLSVQGIGALLNNEGEYVKIQRVIPGGPAFKAGKMQAGDRIIGVAQGEDGEMVDIIGWRTDEAVDLIRGEPGSLVRLLMLSADQNDTSLAEVHELIREKVKLEEQAAQKSIVEVEEEGKTLKIGVIELPAFYVDFEGLRQGIEDFRSSTRDVLKLLNELQVEGVDGIILDLRNNGGGSLTEAITLTGLFCGPGPVVQVKDIDNRVGPPYRSPAGIENYKGPMAVMVNRLSASASEILAGAVYDCGRGLVIGSQTFGKGTVQQLIPMREGQMKLTQAKFYRITGESTQSKGVIPHVELLSTYDRDEIGESAYDRALPWDTIESLEFDKYDDLIPLLPQLRSKHEKRVDNDPEFDKLAERIEFSKERSKQTVVSLNEETRREKRANEEKTLLAIENKRRIALGMDPLEKLEDIETEEKPKDILLDEAAKILGDFINAKKDLGSKSG